MSATLFPTTPPLSVPTFLTVKEAALKSGWSGSSIRRIIYAVLEDDQHSDRQHVEPSVERLKEFRIKGEKFAWRLSEELLERAIKSAEPLGAETAKVPKGDDAALGQLVALLRDELQKTHAQLQVKDQQIDNLSQLMNSLNERLHEGNVLIGSLQRQLALPDGTANPRPDVKSAPATAASRAGKTTPKKTTPRIQKSPEKMPHRKKSFLARLFRG